MLTKEITSIKDVICLLPIMSDWDGARLDESDCRDLRDAAAFLKKRETEHRTEERRAARERSGDGHRPKPTGAPPGRPPSGEGSGRK